MINHFLVIIVKNKRFINVNFYNKTVKKMSESVYKKGFSIGLVLLLAIIGLLPAAGGYHHDQCKKIPLTIIRGNDPYVNITRPREGYNYFSDEERPKVEGVEIVMIFGKVTVKADASPGIDKVVFWINDMDTFHDENAPYEWLWDFKLALGYNTITVQGYDNGESVAEDTIDVFSFMIKDC